MTWKNTSANRRIGGASAVWPNLQGLPLMRTLDLHGGAHPVADFAVAVANDTIAEVCRPTMPSCIGSDPVVLRDTHSAKNILVEIFSISN